METQSRSPSATNQAQGLRFAELFRWLSNSLKSVSRSKTTERVALPAPTGWAEV
jgi:uncharacterized protein YegL